jgi:hypothetical protein
MLLVIGMLNVFEGLVALFADEEAVLTPNRLVVVDLTAFGWTLIVTGLLLGAVGLGLLAAQTWARIAAIIVLCLHIITQLGWIGAYPVWSLLMIALDTVVIFALTARWSDTREGFEDWEERGNVEDRPVRQPVPRYPSAPVT